MVWKTIGKIDGTSTIFGGEDRDKVSNLLNGVSNVDNVKINSDFAFMDGKLQLRNPADTYSYVMKSSALTADINLTFPLITVNDTLATLGLAQTYLAKQTYNAGVDLANQKIENIGQATINDLTEKTTPGSGDFVLATTTAGMRKLDVGNISGGSGGSLIIPLSFGQPPTSLGIPVLQLDPGHFDITGDFVNFNSMPIFYYPVLRFGSEHYTQFFSWTQADPPINTLVNDFASSYPIPASLDPTSVTAEFTFITNAAVTGNVRLQVKSQAFGDNEDITATPFTIEDIQTVEFPTANNTRKIFRQVLNLDVDAGDEFFVRIQRPFTDTLDTYDKTDGTDQSIFLMSARLIVE